jgi:hypothetical protein
MPPQPGSDRPEAVQEVVALLVGRRGREALDAHVAQVELAEQALDHAALARGVPALEDERHRGPSLPPSLVSPAHSSRSCSMRCCAACSRVFVLPLRQLGREVHLVESSHRTPKPMQSERAAWQVARISRNLWA